MCDQEQLFTTKEAAEILGIPESTLRKKVRAGEAPHRKVFKHTRFTTEDIQAIQRLRPGLPGIGRPGVVRERL